MFVPIDIMVLVSLIAVLQFYCLKSENKALARIKKRKLKVLKKLKTPN